jgi:putative transposase
VSKTIYKTYRYALLPTKEQQVLLNKHFGCVRFLYNYFLQEKITQYEETQTSDNYYEQAAKLVELKKQADTKWLKEVTCTTTISRV